MPGAAPARLNWAKSVVLPWNVTCDAAMAVPPPCGMRVTVVPEVNSAPWMVSVVVPEVPAWAGLAPVTWSGRVWAESVNGSPLPEPVSPASRM